MSRIPIYGHLPLTRRIRDLIESGQSVLLISPRSYDPRALARAVVDPLDAADTTHVVTVSSIVDSPDAAPRLDSIWQAIAAHAPMRTAAISDDSLEFQNAMVALHDKLCTKGHRLIIQIEGARRSNLQNHARLLISMHAAIVRCKKRGGNGLVLLAHDDRSTYTSGLANHMTALYLFDKQFFFGLSADELSGVLAHFQEIPSKRRASILRAVLAATDGHPALAADALAACLPPSPPPPPSQLVEIINAAAAQSSVLNEIERVLDGDPAGLTSTALEYEKPRFPEPNTLRPRILQEVGALQQELCGLELKLACGVVTQLIRKVQETSKQHAARIGTVIRPKVTTEFLPGELEIDPDDFVVVHLSDLHIGDHYRFKLDTNQGVRNENEFLLEDLIRNDLEKMGVPKRVDAIVLSGDIVWNGRDIAEYITAETVVRNVCAAAHVPVERLLVLPGNHDVDWGSAKNPKRSGALQNFGTFVRLLDNSKRRGFSGHEVLPVPSPSGNRHLLICALDSTAVESEAAAGIGFICRDVLTAAAADLKAKRAALKGEVQVWAAIHHHPVPATSIPKERASINHTTILANAPELLQWANENDVECILHGHEHQPFINESNRWPFPSVGQFTSIITIGAGSIGVNRDHTGPIGRNHYYLLIRNKTKLFIRSRELSQSNTSFMPHSDIVISRH